MTSVKIEGDKDWHNLLMVDFENRKVLIEGNLFLTDYLEIKKIKD